MKKILSTLLMALLCAGAMVAQERTTRVITIKNGNIIQIQGTVGHLLQGSSVLMSSDGTRLVLSGPKDTVAGFEEIIKQLDVPAPVKKNIETSVYMIVASVQSANVAPLPSELDPVVKQLKGIFSYKGYRLLDSFVLRSRDAERGDTSGFVPPLPDTNVPAGNKIIYQFKYNRVSLDGSDTARVIRFDGLRLGIRVPVGGDGKGGISYVEAGISTDVDVPEGKKVVVGKTSAVEGSDSALILVISAKVVD
jgi:hypothetical protein